MSPITLQNDLGMTTFTKESVCPYPSRKPAVTNTTYVHTNTVDQLSCTDAGTHLTMTNLTSADAMPILTPSTDTAAPTPAPRRAANGSWKGCMDPPPGNDPLIMKEA